MVLFGVECICAAFGGCCAWQGTFCAETVATHCWAGGAAFASFSVRLTLRKEVVGGAHVLKKKSAGWYGALAGTTCDDTPTKWITQGEWDGQLSMKIVNGDEFYIDGDGDRMYVYEEDEEEYHGW